MNLLDYPLLLCLVSFITMCLSVLVAAYVRRGQDQNRDMLQNYDVIRTATLTLLALIIGFSFSMATGRYDLRKNYEEAEANAIGTEYVRATLLPAPYAKRIQGLLVEYTDQRILFYHERHGVHLEKINKDTAELQNQLWAVIVESAESRPAPIVALVASGMNDVLNSQGYTQAAWWNRIPTAAWALMGLIGIFCSLLVGYGIRDIKTHRMLIPLLPLIISIAFFLIADLDSPSGGVIRVEPQNLISVAESLRPAVK